MMIVIYIRISMREEKQSSFFQAAAHC